MELKKLLNNLSEEELLNVLKEDTETYYENVNDLEKFLTFFNLTHGTQLIRKNFLYNIYYKWSKDPLSRRVFGRIMLDYVGSRQIGPYTYFLLNQMPLELKQKSLSLLKPKRDKTKSPTYKKHFDNYLNYYGIRPGKYYLEGFVLYYLYDKWVFSTKKNRPIGYSQFVNFLRLYFDVKRKSKSVNGITDTSKVAWFGITKDILKHISLIEIQQIREGRAKYHGRKEKIKKADKT